MKARVLDARRDSSPARRSHSPKMQKMQVGRSPGKASPSSNKCTVGIVLFLVLCIAPGAAALWTLSDNQFGQGGDVKEVAMKVPNIRKGAASPSTATRRAKTNAKTTSTKRPSLADVPEQWKNIFAANEVLSSGKLWDHEVESAMNPNWHSPFDKIEVINLKRRADRLEYSNKMLDRLHIPSAKRNVMSALDAKGWGTREFAEEVHAAIGARPPFMASDPKLTVFGPAPQDFPVFAWSLLEKSFYDRFANTDEEKIFNTDHKVLAGGACCAFTHMALMHKVAHGSADVVLVMEDDVSPTRWFKDIDRMLRELPKGFDFAKLEDCSRGPMEDDIPMSSTSKRGGLAESIVNHWIPLTKTMASYCTGAYLVSRRGAAKFTKAIPLLRGNNCDDQLLLFAHQPGAKVYVAEYPMFAQDHTIKGDIEDSDASVVSIEKGGLAMTTFHAPRVKKAMKSVIANNMCAFYRKLKGDIVKSPLGEVTCSVQKDEAACSAQCMASATCNSYIWHPDGEEGFSFLCPFGAPEMGDPHWSRKCCLRHDGNWKTFWPMPAEMAEYAEIQTVKSAQLIQWEDPSMQTLYELYGNEWTLARSMCRRQGADLCNRDEICTKGTEFAPQFTAYLDDGKQHIRGGVSPWTPTLDTCAGFLDLRMFPVEVSVVARAKKCAASQSWGAGKASIDTVRPYWLNKDEAFPIACCTRPVRDSSTPKLYQARKVVEHIVLKIDDIAKDVVKKRGRVNVLRIVINHSTAGFFAAMSWALSQLLMAKKHGLVPWVDWAGCVLQGYEHIAGGDFKYYDSKKSGNAWSPLFEGPKRPNIDPSAEVHIYTLQAGQVWMVRDHPDFCAVSYADICGHFNMRIQKDFTKWRAHAWEAMKMFRVDAGIRAEVDRFWKEKAGLTNRVIGVHVRGTDKDPGIGGYKIPPENYYPFIDFYLAKFQGAKIFVATDDPSYLRSMETKYPRQIFYYDAVRSAKNVFLAADDGISGYDKARTVLIDSMLLAKSDFLLAGNSAVAEFAIYFSKRLATRNLNLQFQFLKGFAHQQESVFTDELLMKYIAPIGEECPPEF